MDCIILFKKKNEKNETTKTTITLTSNFKMYQKKKKRKKDNFRPTIYARCPRHVGDTLSFSRQIKHVYIHLFIVHVVVRAILEPKSDFIPCW